MSRYETEPVTPDLPPPFATPDLDTGVEEVVQEHTGNTPADDHPENAEIPGQPTDVNPAAAATEPPD